MQKGYFLVFVAAVLWGSTGIVGKIVFKSGFTPLDVVTYKGLLAFFTLLTWVSIKNSEALKLDLKALYFFMLYGLLGVSVFHFAYFYTISETTVTTAVTLLYTAPAFVIILSRFFFQERITKSKLLALALTLTGSFLVARGYDLDALKLNLPGVLAGLVSGLTYALYSIFGKKALSRYSSATILTYSFGFGSLFLIVFGGISGRFNPPTFHYLSWGLVVYLALFPTLLSYFLYINGLKFIEAGRASLVTMVEPVSAALMAFFILGESPSLLQLLGGALVLAGVATVYYRM